LTLAARSDGRALYERGNDLGQGPGHQPSPAPDSGGIEKGLDVVATRIKDKETNKPR